MVGQVVFEEGNYVETVDQESNGVRLVECSEDGQPGLWRVEWEECGYYQHSAFLQYVIAENNFINRSTGA